MTTGLTGGTGIICADMLGNTSAGDAYTVSEHRQMLQRAGFADCEVRPLRPTARTAFIAVKP